MNKRCIFRPPKLQTALLLLCLVFMEWGGAAAALPLDGTGTSGGQTGYYAGQSGNIPSQIGESSAQAGNYTDPGGTDTGPIRTGTAQPGNSHGHAGTAEEQPGVRAAPGGTQTGQTETPIDQWVKSQVDELPKDGVEKYWNQLMKDYGGFFPEGATPSLMDMLLPGGQGLTLQSVLSGLFAYMWHEVLYNGKLLVTIVMISVLSMILETLQTAFERKAVSKVAYTLCFMVVLVIAVNSFNIAVGYAKDAIDRMIDFMMAMIPLLFALLASMGNIVTVSVTHPLIVFMINTVGTLIHTIVFPLLFFSAVLHLVSSISDKYKLTQLANLLRNIGSGVLGVLLTVFLGVISVRGITSSITDGVTLRAAKYITGNFVPVIGKMFADATDTVVSASLLVKNAIGLSGVIIILFLCAFPAIKILVLALIYNVAGAVMQPLGDTPIVSCLQTIGKSMIYVFAALAAVSLMFFLAVTIMLTAGNVTVMMR